MADTTLNRGTTPRRELGFWRAMLLVFGPFACGYFFSYFFRNVNAVLSTDLNRDLGVNAEQLGLLSSAYFLSFMICQIPLGVLLDRFGPRRVQGTLYALAAVGALLFSRGDSVTELFVARALIGVGVSGGLMGALKAIVLWFPRERYALVNGWYLGCGGIGALAATQPVEFALQFTDWRGVFVILAAATLAASALILLVVPEKPGSASGGTLGQQVSEILKIYRNGYFWRLVPLMFTCASANMAIQGLWAGPWLHDVAGLDRHEVAQVLVVMAGSFSVGVFLSGPFASVLGRFGLSLGGSCCVGAILYTAAIMLAVLQPPLPAAFIWCLVGLFGTLTSLVFAALAQHFPQTHVARANTACNVMVFGAAFIYQSGLGLIIQQWAPLESGGYPAEAYVTAFLCAIATQLVAIVWYLLPIGSRYD